MKSRVEKKHPVNSNLVVIKAVKCLVVLVQKIPGFKGGQLRIFCTGINPVKFKKRSSIDITF